MFVVKTVLLLTVFAGGTFFSWKNAPDKIQATFPGWRDPGLPSKGADDPLNVDDFLVGVIENFRDDMPNGVEELKIPPLDPFRHRKPIRVDVEDSKAVVHANFTDLRVEGLSGFVLEHLSANLKNLTLRFGLRIPRLFATGNYSVDGKILKIVPLRGNGSFWIESLNLSVAARASMETEEHLQLSRDFDVDMDFDSVEMDFENLLGGGRWTEVLKNILNDMSRDLFHKFLPLLKVELNKALLKVMNKQLIKLPITNFIPGSTADEYVDQILLNVRQLIRDQKLDPLSLPEYHSNFSKEVAFVTFYGEVRLFNGWLSGISSIRRTDECQLNSSRTRIQVSAHLGLKDLRLYYKGRAKFMSWGPNLEAGGSVKHVSFYFRIEQENRKGAVPDLQEFRIQEVSTIWVELSGLGPLTWIMKWMLTGLSTLIDDFIAQKVTEYMKGYLQEELTKISFPV